MGDENILFKAANRGGRMPSTYRSQLYEDQMGCLKTGLGGFVGSY